MIEIKYSDIKELIVARQLGIWSSHENSLTCQMLCLNSTRIVIPAIGKTFGSATRLDPRLNKSLVSLQAPISMM